MSFRSYNEVTGSDRSDLLGQVVAQRNRVAERLKSVKQVVAVMSGKGGVGKSYVTAMLARAITDQGKAVGVLDADLKSPTCARLLGARGPLRVSEQGVEPSIGVSGIRLFSTDLLLEEGKPLTWREPDSERFVWRGVLETGALREFLSDVVWGELDLLLVDLPPGGDRLADLAALVPDLAGAVAVTIPSEESRRSVERSIRSALDASIRMLGVVENMSGYSCARCGEIGPLFEGDAGTSLSAQFGIPLLASIPFGHRDHDARPSSGLVEAFFKAVS